MTAIGAVDLALWDIKGKATGQPVYQLLGGAVRDRILSYTHATGWDVPALLDSIDAARERGFQAIRAQTGVPGLDTVYGVSQGRARHTSPPGGAPRRSRRSGTPTPTCGTRPSRWPRPANTSDPRWPCCTTRTTGSTPTRPPGWARRWNRSTCSGSRTSPPPRTRRCCGTSAAHTTVPLAIGEVFNTDLGIPDADHRAADRLRPRGGLPRRRDQPRCAASPRSPRSGRSASARTARPTSPRSPSRLDPRRPGHTELRDPGVHGLPGRRARGVPARLELRRRAPPPGRRARPRRPRRRGRWPPGSPTNPPTCRSRAAATAP